MDFGEKAHLATFFNIISNIIKPPLSSTGYFEVNNNNDRSVHLHRNGRL